MTSLFAEPPFSLLYHGIGAYSPAGLRRRRALGRSKIPGDLRRALLIALAISCLAARDSPEWPRADEASSQASAVPRAGIQAWSASPSDGTWYSLALSTIALREYEISYDETLSAFQSPNRAQDFRFVYCDDGFAVQPRSSRSPVSLEINRPAQEPGQTSAEDWQVSLSVRGFGRAGRSRSFEGKGLSVIGNKASIEDRSLRIEYQNDRMGMRQDFIVKKRPSGSGPLQLDVEVDTSLSMSILPEAVSFASPESGGKLMYHGLKAWDAGGEPLEARFEPWSEAASLRGMKGQGFSIAVDDGAAAYPITIDPLSAAPDWTDESDQVKAGFGWAVSYAGDVNGDGFGDAAVGTPYYDNGQADEGAVFVYLGSETGLSEDPWVVEGQQPGCAFGYSVSSAGDVNGDGYGDVVVGAPYHDGGEEDEGKVFVYYGSAAGLASERCSAVECDSTGAAFGYSVSSAGDVNGDGFCDVVIGAPFFEIAPFYTHRASGGKAFVYHGSAGGLASIPAWTAWGGQEDMKMGYSVSLAGDVNGDGYGDVIVGASGFYSEHLQERTGIAFVYHGSAEGLSRTCDWSMEGGQPRALFADSVSYAGDVNGDGFGDIMISSPEYDTVECDEGMVLAFFGGAGGLSSSADWGVKGSQAGGKFGYGISSAGDVNGDGFCDVVIGSPYFDDAYADGGKAFVFLGSEGGLPAQADWTAEGERENAAFGASVSRAGDVNGDGRGDILIGARFFGDGQENEGKAYAFYASSGGLPQIGNWSVVGQFSSDFGICVSTAGDLDGDGFSEILIGAPEYDSGQEDEGKIFVYRGSAQGLSSTPAWTAEGDQAHAAFGFSVSSAGDVNGDGYDDLIVGAPGYRFGGGAETVGMIFVYLGSPTGIVSLADWSAPSDQDNSSFGWSVSAAGDINGDGYDDIAVGAPQFDGERIDMGKAFVYAGSPSGIAAGPCWTTQGEQGGSWFGESISTAGDVNGDGCADLIVGALLYDDGLVDAGKAYVYRGSPDGLSAAASWTALGETAFSWFGDAVSTAGDVNGDGYDDVIVGAHGYFDSHQNGKVYVYQGSPNGLPQSETCAIKCYSEHAFFGYSVSAAGDVNGDGYGDVIIGAKCYGDGETHDGEIEAYFEGKAYLHLGSDLGLSHEPCWTIEGDQEGAQLGAIVSMAGDVDSDGYDDIIVGSPYWWHVDLSTISGGKVIVLHGKQDFSD
jgi:hypothetical protein